MMLGHSAIDEQFGAEASNGCVAEVGLAVIDEPFCLWIRPYWRRPA